MGEVKIIESPEDIGEFLRLERFKQRFDQRDLALAAGTVQSVISEHESGAQSYGISLTLRVAAALGYNLALVPFEYQGDAYDD